MTSMESRAAVTSPTRPWPADRVELWPIEKLIPYANNPGLHSAADVERIAASILKWGWTNPVLVDEQGVPDSPPEEAGFEPSVPRARNGSFWWKREDF